MHDKLGHTLKMFAVALIAFWVNNNRIPSQPIPTFKHLLCKPINFISFIKWFKDKIYKYSIKIKLIIMITRNLRELCVQILAI